MVLSVCLQDTPSLKGKARITLAGACRHADDEARLAVLKQQAEDLAKQLGIEVRHYVMLSTEPLSDQTID